MIRTTQPWRVHRYGDRSRIEATEEGGNEIEPLGKSYQHPPTGSAGFAEGDSDGPCPPVKLTIGQGAVRLLSASEESVGKSLGLLLCADTQEVGNGIKARQVLWSDLPNTFFHPDDPFQQSKPTDGLRTRALKRLPSIHRQEYQSLLAMTRKSSLRSGDSSDSPVVAARKASYIRVAAIMFHLPPAVRAGFWEKVIAGNPTDIPVPIWTECHIKLHLCQLIDILLPVCQFPLR
jgi:hypothetical protein